MLIMLRSLVSVGLFLVCYRGWTLADVTDLHERLHETCTNENRTDVCVDADDDPPRSLIGLKRSHCFCDAKCVLYDDCCIDGPSSSESVPWSCREVRAENVSRIPIYVRQLCPASWKDHHFREMCEVEAVKREKLGLYFNHMQDIPVFSENSGIWYRNVYCAVCNNDTRLTKWETYIYCNGDSSSNSLEEEDLDFGEAVYVPRTMNYRRVKSGETYKNCQIMVRNFNLQNMFSQGVRLCKDAISKCADGYESLQEKCDEYTSYVYKKTSGSSSKRIVYKNSFCAECNGVKDKDLLCTDPYMPHMYTTVQTSYARESALTMLFDFNYNGQLGENKCLMSEGQIWDPLFRICQNFTCGSLFKREGVRCTPINSNYTRRDGLTDDCPKVALNQTQFTLLANKTILVNASALNHLEPEDYEVSKRDKTGAIVEILICLHTEDSSLLPLSGIHYLLSVVTLSISIVCLVLHLVVYGMLKSLRNIPGKILMSLSSSLLCGHVFLLLGRHLRHLFALCYVNGVLMQLGYLSAFAWMSVMAYDIHGTFAVTQTHNSRKTSQVFRKYSAFAWTCSCLVATVAIVFDHTLEVESEFRPRFGDPICWFNSPASLLTFFVVPATVLLISNTVLFARTAVHIRQVSQQTKAVKSNLSDKVRYFLYIKVAVVLGLTWVLGVVAAIVRVNILWYPFTVLNGLQGALIFAAFTLKRNIFHMLAVKLRIRSERYNIGRRKGLKAAMYSSLSNLTTLQTSLSSQIPRSSSEGGMLKAIRRINPDDSAQKF